MKLAIIGSRSFGDYKLLCRMVNEHFPQITQVVSGGAHGADELARRYALERGIEIVEHLPQWKLHGRAAGHIRNRLIIDDAEAVLAFWDGTSRGTHGGLKYARKLEKQMVVVYVLLRDEGAVVSRVDTEATLGMS